MSQSLEAPRNTGGAAETRSVALAAQNGLVSHASGNNKPKPHARPAASATLPFLLLGPSWHCRWSEGLGSWLSVQITAPHQRLGELEPRGDRGDERYLSGTQCEAVVRPVHGRGHVELPRARGCLAMLAGRIPFSGDPILLSPSGFAMIKRWMEPCLVDFWPAGSGPTTPHLFLGVERVLVRARRAAACAWPDRA